MNWLRALGGAAVLWITTVLGVVVASLFAANDLFRGSGYGRAVAAALLLILISLLIIAATGRPDRSPNRTPYW